MKLASRCTLLPLIALGCCAALLDAAVFSAPAQSMAASRSSATPPGLVQAVNRFSRTAALLIRADDLPAFQRLVAATVTPDCEFMEFDGRMTPYKQEQAQEAISFKRIASVSSCVYKIQSIRPAGKGYVATSSLSVTGIARDPGNGKQQPFTQTTLQERLWINSGGEWKIGSIAVMKFSETVGGVTESVSTSHSPQY